MSARSTRSRGPDDFDQTDKAAGGEHHRLPVTAAGSVAEDKVVLEASAENAMATWLPVEKPGNDTKK